MPAETPAINATVAPDIDFNATDPLPDSSSSESLPLEQEATADVQPSKDAKSLSMDELTGAEQLPEIKHKKEKPAVTSEEEAEDAKAEEEDEDAEEEKEEDDGKIENDPIKDKDVEKDLKQHGNTKRDYSGLTANQVKLLKRVDTPRYEAFSKEMRVLNELAGKSVELIKQLDAKDQLLKTNGIPPQWYEHPQAYTLSKEFQQISSTYQQQAMLEEHYTQQLLNVRNGQEWQQVSFDAQGNPIAGAKLPANNNADVWLTQQLARCAQIKGNLEGKSESLKQGFENYHKQSSAGIKQEVDGYIERMDESLKPEDKDMQSFVGVLPQIYKDHPLSYCASKMFGVMVKQAREINRLKGIEVQKQKVEQDKKLAGVRVNKPGPKSPTSSGKTAGGEMLSMAMFERNE